ncbi:MAG TPA: hypothetical protein VMS86_11880 [Thermoanaerobaculia bacterium]|nr:hypothetical protein [Thermoanaerobaculia bacterium]
MAESASASHPYGSARSLERRAPGAGGCPSGARRSARLARRALALGLALAGAAEHSADAQQAPVLEVVEDVDFDRPEAWAMKYFGSISMLTPLAPARPRPPGTVELALEVSQVPHLSTAERTVGFNGLKEEDLNRLPVLVRPRVTVALPRRLAIEVGYVPPVRVDGVEPNLFSLALERALYAGERWSVAGRVHGQLGEVEGDLTCSKEDASFPPGSPDNAFGCEAPSRDVSTLDHVGLHLGAGYELPAARGSTLLFGVGVVRHDLEFQVDALTFGLHDRTLLRADGTTYALNAGISIPASERTLLAFEVLWSALDVVRPPRTAAENDDLLHLRAILRYRVR